MRFRLALPVTIAVSFLLLAACAPGATPPAPAQAVLDASVQGIRSYTVEPLPRERRWRVAVPQFDVRSSNLKVRGEELPDRDPAFFVELGSGVADIFLNEALRSGQFILFERAQLDQVLREQNLGITGRVDPQTAAEVGRITGVELLALGALTEFSVTSTGGGGRLFGLIGGSAEIVTARVTVDIRFVDAVTAEIISTGSHTSEQSQGNVQIDVFNILRGLQAGRAGTTIVDLAVRNAIIGAIDDGARNLPPKPGGG